MSPSDSDIPSQRQQSRYTTGTASYGGLYLWQFARFTRKTASSIIPSIIPSAYSDLLCTSVTRPGGSTEAHVGRSRCCAAIPVAGFYTACYYGFSHIHRNEATEEHNGNCLHSLLKMVDNESSLLAVLLHSPA